MTFPWLLLACCAVALVVVWRGCLPRFEAISVALFIVAVACVAVGSGLSQSLSAVPMHGDGRALLACVAGPALALLVRERLRERAATMAASAASTALLLLGLISHTLTIALPAGTAARVAVGIALGATIAAMAAAAVVAGLRARAQPTLLWRRRAGAEAAAATTLGAAALVGAAPVAALGASWAALCAVAVVVLAAARAAPRAPGSEVIVAAAVALVLAAIALPWTSLVGVVSVAAVAAVVAGAASLPSSSAAAAATAVETPQPTTAASLPLAGLGGTTPLLDDGLMRRPERPRVLSRTSARRLADAAVESAWRAQPGAERRRAPVEIVGGDDADIDGDASELAYVLCVVLDNALKARARAATASPDGTDSERVRLVVRAAAHTVSFEVDEGTDQPADAALGWRPFFDHDTSTSRPGLGASLSRARLIVERHGGQLHVRSEGVQVTLPRRVTRGPVGLA